MVVVANRETGDLQQLETALYSAGYHVLTARSERETVQKIQAHQPDALLLGREVCEQPFVLCRSLRSTVTVSPATPIIFTQDAPPTRADRLEALRAGAWDSHGFPPDVEELELKLAVYLHAKREVDRLVTECLIDRGSGLYNAHGFRQRAEELAALNNRQGAPAACAIFRPSEDLPTGAAGDRLGRAFKSVGRLSDAIGRTDAGEFAVFAPATSDWAAARLVRRVRDNVTQEVGYLTEQGKRLTLRAAYSATIPSHKVEPTALLERARKALRS